MSSALASIVHMLQALPTTPLPSSPRRPVLVGALVAAVGLHALLVWSLMARAPALPLGVQPRVVTTSLLLPELPPAARAEPAPVAAPRPARAPGPAAQAFPEQAVAATAAPQTVAGFSWQYLLIQGDKQGTARLSWRPDDGHYEALLERELEGKPLPAWRSLGDLDPGSGLAPRRFAQRQQGKQGPRDRQATNFRRDEGLISFSASPALLPLQEGAQDRISWWLQLAALVDAEPQRYQSGTELVMPVATLKGELQQWHFRVLDQEGIELPAGRLVQSLHLLREPVGAWDARIELWLDPARHHLPVRVRHVQGGVLRWELLLQRDDQPPAP